MRDLAHTLGSRATTSPSPLVQSFFVALAFLELSQLFIFPPGTNVGPYVYAQGELVPAQEFLGMTVFSWATLVLAGLCAVGLARVAAEVTFSGIGAVWAAVVVVLVRGLLGVGQGLGALDAAAKLAIPFVVYLFLAGWTIESRRRLAGILTLVNCFLIAQSVLSKLATGRFSVNTYYLELSEEYFGFFYHPFAFVGSLGICSLVALHQAAAGRRILLNGSLLVTNLWFIYQSQVRTYMLAVVVALAVSVVLLAVERRRFSLATLIGVAVSLVALAVSPLDLAGDRRVDDISSGRLERWASDLRYLWAEGDGLHILFGGGGGYIQEVNQRLLGTSINSLNFFVDVLADYGAVGVLVVTIAWLALVRRAWFEVGWSFAGGMAVFWLISSFITNVFEFPSVGVLFVVALACPPFVDRPIHPPALQAGARPGGSSMTTSGRSHLVPAAAAHRDTPRRVQPCRTH